MKKLQNYLVKPDQLKKKLENPAFKHDFIQWSKSHLCGPSYSRQSKSKSPSENYRRNYDSQNSKNHQSKSKQNIKPNTAYNSHQSLNTNTSQKKNFKINFNDDNKSKIKSKPNKLVSHTRSHTHFNSYGHNKSTDDVVNSSIRTIQNRDRSKNCSVSSIQNLKKGKEGLLIPKPKKNNSKKQLQMDFTYSYRTRQGVLATNPKKTNQDRLLIKTKIVNQNNNLFAVADGHGLNGHFVSQLIANNMSKVLEKQMEKKKIEDAFPAVFDELQKDITDSQFNVSCSGSTLVSIILQPNHITCANVGDSRAILARQVDKKSWEMIYLSQDHKPSVQSQKKRILKHGGRIHALKDEKGHSVGPQRVWLPSQNIQGLAMSRSLGDNVSKPHGVTHKPQIIKIASDKRDKFILLASDGVWEFLTNQEVLQLIVPFYRQKKLQQACDALLKLAYEKWTVEDTSVVDDITFILIFLNYQ